LVFGQPIDGRWCAMASRPGVDTVSMTFDQILRDRAVTTVFQPIVRIDTHEIVGFEALARGPVGSPWAAPATLFAEAYRSGRASELDWVCRASATRAFLAAGMPDSTALFVNVEPTSLGSACPPDLVDSIVAAAAGRRHMVLELTERSVARDPAGMLTAVETARRASMGIALDDVGVDPASLAMMPLIRPDVIKLDLTVIQGRTTQAVATIVNAVMAEAERTGAAILAEGIESEHHVRVAQAMGATLGQGWLYGPPGSPPNPPLEPRHPIDLLPVHTPEVPTPFHAAAGRRLSQATERILQPMSLHLEYKGLDTTEPTVLLACFQDADRFGAPTRRRYTQLAARGVFTAVVSRDMPPEPGPGIRGARLDPADPMGHEWTVILLGAHFAAAILAKERDDNSSFHESSFHERVFDFVLTHDRDIVIAAARPLLKRILAADRPPIRNSRGP
jgi:EAL domain-containing protein (putative c-di-GMP-specific phosphodiesterase class I)